jgi:hypothetical protein
VAVVRDSIADRTTAALLNGVPAVGFKVYRAKGFDETRIVEGVTAALNRARKATRNRQVRAAEALWSSRSRRGTRARGRSSSKTCSGKGSVPFQAPASTSAPVAPVRRWS